MIATAPPTLPPVSEIPPAELERFACRLAAAGAVGASVAHELRNSLAVAESALFLAQRNIDDRTRLQKHLDQVGAEIRKAHGVIGSILGLARGEPVHREPTSASEIVEAARQTVVLPKHIEFELHIDPPDLSVLCDPILLERVASNLYLNAVEALSGRTHGRILTTAYAEDEGTILQVEDDGPGVDPSVCSQLFNPMVTNKPKGTGLGLSLCRTIAEAHGGRISCAKSRYGGAAFRLWLPGA